MLALSTLEIVSDALAQVNPVTKPPGLVLNGRERATWPAHFSIASFRELEGASVELEAALVAHYQAEGYFAARVDSIEHDPTGLMTVHLQTGSRTYLGSIHVSGAKLFSESEILDALKVMPGAPFRASDLEAGLDRLVRSYAERSFQMAEVEIDRLEMGPPGDSTLAIYVRVHEGPETRLSGIRLPGSTRTQSSYVVRELGLVPGAPFGIVDLKTIENELRESGLFERVESASIEVYEDSTLLLFLPVTERPPGTFDFVLGFLPSSDQGSSSQLIGSGHLDLLNPFGYGRSFEFGFDRFPNQISSGRVRFADPQVAGYPLRVDLGFSGYQRDSTYSQQSLSIELAYRFSGGVRSGARYTGESTRPGQAGNRIVGDTQRIPTSTRRFWGLAAYVRHLDVPQNPRRGNEVEMIVETGTKTETGLAVLPGADTTNVRLSQRQERLQMTLRTYRPAFSNQTLVFGADIRVLLSPTYSENDLFRMGGASTLRGYDEERFLASTAIRFLSEYRVLVGPLSYAFAFVDVGYVERPELGQSPAKSGWYPGYGIGMQWSTAAGLLKASYAINNEDGPTKGRVHVGLAFGL